MPCGPLQFSLRGFRDRARGLLQPGDLVAIVGTFGANTPEKERGMILGLMEPSTVVVSSLDYFDLNAVRDVDRDEHGNYRWLFGLELRAAWRFTEPRTPNRAGRHLGTAISYGFRARYCPAAAERSGRDP